MKQIRSYGDERTLAFCAFCGGETGTRDHCPSRIFLDEPYPENLPVVPACSTCNSSFSVDEEYLACLLSCVIVGSTIPETLPRAKIRCIMSDKPSLRTRIERACFVSDGTIVFKPEHERVVSVLTKLAKGHALYELHEQCIDPPDDIFVVPLTLFDNTQRDIFERPELPEIWPEVGSRMMQRLVEGTDITLGGWIIVQPEQYRYNASVSRGIDIRIVIQEYLAGYIHWD